VGGLATVAGCNYNSENNVPQCCRLMKPQVLHNGYCSEQIRGSIWWTIYILQFVITLPNNRLNSASAVQHLSEADVTQLIDRIYVSLQNSLIRYRTTAVPASSHLQNFVKIIFPLIFYFAQNTFRSAKLYL
jgi:hypothetical protein